MAFLAIAPTGTVLPFAGSVAPEGWLLCDGTAKSRTTYSKLFEVINTTFGVGDGSTTFNLPDMRGVFPRGSGTNADANYGGVSGHQPAGGTVAAKGGQKTAKNGLSNASSALTSTSANSGGVAHTHTFPWGINAGAGTNRIGSTFQSSDISFNSSTSGASAFNHTHTVSGTATAQVISGDNETTPASLTLNYIIKL